MPYCLPKKDEPATHSLLAHLQPWSPLFDLIVKSSPQDTSGNVAQVSVIPGFLPAGAVNISYGALQLGAPFSVLSLMDAELFQQRLCDCGERPLVAIKTSIGIDFITVERPRRKENYPL